MTIPAARLPFCSTAAGAEGMLLVVWGCSGRGVYVDRNVCTACMCTALRLGCAWARSRSWNFLEKPASRSWACACEHVRMRMFRGEFGFSELRHLAARHGMCSCASIAGPAVHPLCPETPVGFAGAAAAQEQVDKPALYLAFGPRQAMHLLVKCKPLAASLQVSSGLRQAAALAC